MVQLIIGTKAKYPELFHGQCTSIKQGESDDLIQIDELWVTAAIFNDDVAEPAKYIQKEAKRRLRLYKDVKSSNKTEERGNMLVVFGHNDNVSDLKKLPKTRNPTAGDLFKRICGEEQTDWETFVHCPFHYIIKDNDNNEKPDRNDSSLVVQAVIKDGDAKAELLIGGDAGCAIWKTINRETKKYKNTADLMWDVFYAPHHGSYKFFTQKEHEEGHEEAENNPDKDSMEIIDRGNDNSWIVCSSRPIKDDNYEDGDPPHIEAIKHYKEKAAEDNFVCLMEHPDEDNPEPLVLRLTQNGLQEKAFAVASIGTGSKTIATPKKWGKACNIH
ncbi:MAG: hypothetical protein ABIJ91_00785 [Candidatus Kuenenbacteria bacterium]